ncbi:DUF4892 domain-containing protein [Marinobacter sp. M1N3S26]|uniref:DUF4892 domain-containing protein n=1 Tax=Marinobacter sp. M1N3S26 TaxID=3382299 RepID=UPI00387ADC02
MPIPDFTQLRALLVLTVLSVPFAAQASVLPDFPLSTLEEERSITAAGHRVMLSAIREVGDEVRAERSVRLEVDGTGHLYLLNPDADRRDARAWYLEALQARNATILFQCEGRQCGRSNVWANQVFDQASLYGRDTNQDYLVAGWQDEAGQRWLVLLYTVTRGNQRDHLWVEQLRLADGAEIPGFQGIGSRVVGPVIVPWEGDMTVRFDWDVETRRRIESMAKTEGSRVAIAAFTGLEDDETVEDAIERAERVAGTMSDLLDRSGISRSRHLIQGIGPLVDVASPGRPENRIEILVIAPPAGGSTDD